MKALEEFMVGKIVYVDHPATCLNPNGRNGFTIKEVRRDDAGKFAFRGENTMWFGEGCVLRFAA